MAFLEKHSDRLGESYFYMTHPTGVRIYVYPKPEYEGAYAIFGANCGSVDDNFKLSDENEFTRVPAGIAHFLEHKLFENEDCDAFERYAKTGASANAYTSFDRTCYLFSCTENFEQSFEILLDFVQNPYFTQETVEKEQGIIGQEIKMYDDSADWRVMTNLFAALYKNHPIRLDIAGTVESISEITADLLYRCYGAFYHPSNMVLAVAGSVDPEQVLSIADRMLKPTKPVTLECAPADEPEEICESLVRQHLDVGIPIFNLGFKDKLGTLTAAQSVRMDILLESIFEKWTPLYRKLMDDGLINPSFSAGYLNSRDTQTAIISGESQQPEAVRNAIYAELERLRREGIDPQDFECAKRSIYGQLVAGLASNEGIANAIADCCFSGIEIYSLLDEAAAVTLDEINEMLNERLDISKSALSIIE